MQGLLIIPPISSHSSFLKYSVLAGYMATMLENILASLLTISCDHITKIELCYVPFSLGGENQKLGSFSQTHHARMVVALRQEKCHKAPCHSEYDFSLVGINLIAVDHWFFQLLRFILGSSLYI